MPRASPVFRPALWSITGKIGWGTIRLGHNRLGVTVSTKLGHAVVRNRVRRRIREIFRLSQGKMKQGYDCIVVARTRAAHADYWELKRAFEKTCKKLDLWETQA